MMEIAKTAGLFVITAVAEIVGCYLPYLWLKQGKLAGDTQAAARPGRWR